MKIKNTTHWPDHFLRRMLAWCCKQVGVSPRQLRQVAFGKRSRGAFNGRAWSASRRIRVVVGPPSRFPVEPFLYPGRTNDAFMSPRFADQVEALVAVTAHELEHIRRGLIWQSLTGAQRQGRVRQGERSTRHEERRVHAMFVASKDALLAEWLQAPAAKAVRPKPTVQEKRAVKALEGLARWQRKLKLAQTKIRKLKTRVRYYERLGIAANRAK